MPLPQVVDQDVVTFYNELLQEGELSEEETKLLESIVGKEKIWKKFKSGLHARSKFDQEMDRNKKEREKFEAEYTKKLGELDTLRESLATGTDLSKAQTTKLQSRITALETQLFNASQKAKEFDDGEDVLKKLGLDSSYVPPKQEEKKEDSKSSFDKDEFLKEITGQINTNSRALAKFNFDLRKMEREYFSLTGKELDTDELYTKLDTNIDKYQGNYMKLFEDEYSIPKLREDKLRENIRAEVEKELDAKYAKKESERAMSTSERVAKTSDFSQAIESTIPDDAKEESGNPMGMSNRSEVVNEAASFMQKLREKKEAA